ncbi:MAG: TonB-dependent receptor, partial [Bacteroidota bacterium]|nr:TonB-dependent receptor [Bacteroidota bacterium]
GFEFRYYTQKLHSNNNPYDGQPFYDVYSDEWGGGIYATSSQAAIDRMSQPYHRYRFSVYLLDQIKYNNIIINPGLRFDYFNPNSTYRTQYNPLPLLQDSTGFADATAKYQVSPRISVKYPLTDRSNIQIAYGLYFKMPELQRLYDGYNLERTRGNMIVGDPNMNAQRTNMFEASYSNQFTDDIAIDIGAYYKDVYNQLGLNYVPASPNPYYLFAISEYGSAKGVEIELKKQANDHFSISINYNLSWATGTSPDPGSNYNPPTDPYTGKQAFPQAEFYVDWDRRHRVNAIIDIFWANNEGFDIFGVQPIENMNINLSGFFQTGTPYTRTDPKGKPLSEVNAERQPSRWQLDMRISKKFMLRDIFGESAKNSSILIFADVINILNNVTYAAVYASSGSPDDDGDFLFRQLGDFSSTTAYDEANMSLVESVQADQYDSFGNRTYSTWADFDKNGNVTQAERLNSYFNYMNDALQFRRNYIRPREVFVGVMFAF